MSTAGPNNYLGNELRNCRLANHSAPKGAAIYVNGEHRKGLAGMNAENPLATSHGVITANGRAFIDMDHCDVVNNVGYPFKADNKTTRSNIEMPFHGYIRVDNSLIFCNGDKPLFGGSVSYMPLNVNPCVNAASLSEYGGNNIPRSDIEDYDITDSHRRQGRC